jgi:benzodiazapine receptor
MTSVKSAASKYANVLAFAATVIVNGLAGSTTLIGGKVTADVSDANPTLITPAGYVFAIWGIIYVLLGAFVVFQALPGQTGKDCHGKIGWLFVQSGVLNIVWLFLWQFEQLGLSVVVMFLLLATLIAMYLRLDIGKATAPLREKLAVHLPVSVYLGWITIASIANVAATLVSINWDGFGVSRETWATLILAVAVLITVLVIATRRDLGYGLVIIWAAMGIAANQSEHPNIVIAAQISAAIVTVALAASILLTRARRK